ncbi:MAG TPA: carboxypeptidase-like regulatory domain-containing protein, partial [Flavisolibacter sp.]|nr:carboxypeptidase-like regulatory domain-containing protein [Flavisolibacter sp.]
MKKLHVLLFALLFFSALSVFAQDPFGSIEGNVKDQQGAVVQNATVTVRNIATNATKTVTTNENGHYRVLQLQPGNYEVKA